MLDSIKTLKNAPTCFDHYSDHLQGARIFLVKIADFKICYNVKSQCGDAAA